MQRGGGWWVPGTVGGGLASAARWWVRFGGVSGCRVAGTVVGLPRAIALASEACVLSVPSAAPAPCSLLTVVMPSHLSAASG